MLEAINTPLMPTRQRCQQHPSCAETLAVVGDGTLAVQDRRHGTSHALTLDLPTLVKMLDPAGTSYQPVR